jgi:hypothetical protein
MITLEFSVVSLDATLTSKLNFSLTESIDVLCRDNNQVAITLQMASKRYTVLACIHV